MAVWVGLINFLECWRKFPELTKVPYRLPRSLRPLEYNITLHPFIYTSKEESYSGGFNPTLKSYLDGHVQIKFLCVEDTSQIILHSKNLRILKVLLAESGSNIQIREVLVVAPDLLYIVVNSDMLRGHTYLVDIEYTGKFVESSNKGGVFVNHYTQGNSTTYLLWSQFSPYDARRAFPCFDEPEYKARFNIVLIRRHHMTSLSNAHLMYTENISIASSVRKDKGTWMADHFAQTPEMSTYLVCFVISEYSHIEATTSSGTVVRVWTRPEVIHKAEVSLGVAVSAQEWFEEYTGLLDPMQKMDHFARKEPYGGAMENWGLIVYDENILISHERWSDSQHQKASFGIIAHEVAHQWFGNLVTCHWWNDNWLNEGFASMFESFPLEGVLVSAYGAIILRMVQQVLTPQTFKRGIQRYLRKFAYSTATSDDLWDSLSEQAVADNISDTDGSPLILKHKFDPWLDQIGYPTIHVSWDPVFKTIHLTQSPCNTTRDGYVLANGLDYKWNIPITIGDRSTSAALHSGVDVWMDRQDIGKTIYRISKASLPCLIAVVQNRNLTGDWIMINIGAHTLCRVQYDQETFKHIAEQLLKDHKVRLCCITSAKSRVTIFVQVIHKESRAQFIGDSFELAEHGLISAVDALKAAQYLGKELEGLPWEMAIGRLQQWLTLIRRYASTWQLFQDYLRKLVYPVYEEIGWDKPQNDFFGSLLRKRILQLSCELGNEDCIRNAKLRFQQWIIYPDSVEVDQRFTVLCYGIRHGTQRDWDFAYNRSRLLMTCDLPRAKDEIFTILETLPCSSDTGTLLRSDYQHLFKMGFENFITGFVSNADYSDLMELAPQSILHSDSAWTRLALKGLAKDRAWVTNNIQPMHEWLSTRMVNNEPDDRASFENSMDYLSNSIDGP
ncbi:hypothetical protein CAPTEDRAFT_195493 [Capitella teleta]|uniref:Aminopeptidase n=1 Tax=Capitella teleta TaxID=283909 RepID=R7V4N6_CAPTE|nr:hypothetical protein CAPTEDRAFT_195493 [Capitella teleta]|eukprot:ELU13808.1 hypothetical protein CAPTEDRAFT_195493 [Capitella teleta]